MGLDLTWRVIPFDSELFACFRRGELLDDADCLDAYYYQQTEGGFDTPQTIALVAPILATRPDIGRREVDNGNRTWDALCYLLSPARRAGPEHLDDLGYRIIHGGERVYEGRGNPSLRFLAPDEVARAAAFLASIDESRLFAAWDPPDMAESVYKFDLDRAEERRLVIWEDFCELRAFYLGAMRDEAVLVRSY